MRIFRSLLKGVRDCFASFLGFVIFEQGPRQHVPGVNITADFQLVPGERESLGQFQIVVGVEKRKIAIMDLPIDLT